MQWSTEPSHSLVPNPIHSSSRCGGHTPAQSASAAALLQQPALLDGVLFHLEEHESIVLDDSPPPLPALEERGVCAMCIRERESVYVWSRKVRYNMKYVCVNGDTRESLILVSVGSEFPAGVHIHLQERNPALAERAVQTYGHLPPIVTGLHEEAAADLMARVSLELQAPSVDLVRLCLDVPGKQRSKEYYLKTIEEFLKHCQQPVGMLHFINGLCS